MNDATYSILHVENEPIGVKSSELDQEDVMLFLDQTHAEMYLVQEWVIDPTGSEEMTEQLGGEWWLEKYTRMHTERILRTTIV